MNFHKEKRKVLADYLVKFSLALLTALIVRVFFGEANIDAVVYFVALIVVIVTLALGMYLVPSENTKDIMPTEIKKGVIHIQNATVSNGK